MTPAAPPHNIDAEQAVLGALLFDNTLLEVCDSLRAEAFYDPLHGRIWGWITETVQAGRVADAVSLRPRLDQEPCFAEIGGGAYLLTLLERAARLRAHLVSYVDSVRDLSVRRELITLARDIEQIALSPPEGALGVDVAAEAQIAFQALASASTPLAADRISVITQRAVAQARAKKLKGASTGIAGIDDLTAGGRPAHLWILAGATSMGKSVGGQEIALSVAQAGLGVCYFALEMDAAEIGLRVASRFAWRASGVGLNKANGNPAYLDAARGALSAAQWASLESAAQAVDDLPVWVDTTPGLTLPQIESRARRLIAEMRQARITPGLIVIDHQGLIVGHERHASELEAARARGNALKAMAKRLNVWTVALAQVTKEGAAKDGAERLPVLDDIAYGAALTQAADVVILLHREAYYAERKPKHAMTDEDHRARNSLRATLIVDKARGGRRGKVDVIMDVASAFLKDAAKGELEAL